MGKPTKQTDSAILDRIFNLYCDLSPENLSCDGELSGSQVRAKAARLRAELKACFAELGREVTEDEAWDRRARQDDEQREYEQRCRYDDF